MEIHPAVRVTRAAPQKFAPWSFANCCLTFSGLYAFYDMAVPVQALLTCNKFKQNAKTQIHEHNVSLIVVMFLAKRAYEAEIWFQTFTSLRIKLFFWTYAL